MCPSCLATREEKDTTRGRARVLQEMLAPGGPVQRLARARGARRARPVPVLQGLLVATARPGSTWPPTRRRCCTSPTGAGCARGRTTRWAGCRAGPISPPGHPGWSNAVPRLAAGRPAGQVVGRGWTSAATCRRSPPRTFRQQWAERRGAGRRRRTPVALWVDSFTDHFAPEVARGRRPGARGGRLPGAGARRRHLLRAHLDHHRPARRRPPDPRARRSRALAPLADAGVPIVGLEPSCTAVLRGDALELVGGAGGRAGGRRRPAPWPSCWPRRPAGTPPSLAGIDGRRPAALPPRLGAGLVGRRRAAGRRRRRRSPASAAAAGWPATGASSAGTTTCRWRSPSSSCCPPCAGSPTTPSSWPTGSPAARSSTSSPAAGASTWRSCWPSACPEPLRPRRRPGGRGPRRARGGQRRGDAGVAGRATGGTGRAENSAGSAANAAATSWTRRRRTRPAASATAACRRWSCAHAACTSGRKRRRDERHHRHVGRRHDDDVAHRPPAAPAAPRRARRPPASAGRRSGPGRWRRSPRPRDRAPAAGAAHLRGEVGRGRARHRERRAGRRRNRRR